MKNLEQLMASFLCKKDFLDPEGTKSGGVPHIQLSESIKNKAVLMTLINWMLFI